ncbi:acyltransferase [Burkholderia cenocepacia]|uniref:acyltransferase n=1 Tax=Burkholderia cenocepacia TaxID=95486 RepID=UPI001F2A201E|nr:acyltransferase [Burkholderia cenocepacia]
MKMNVDDKGSGNVFRYAPDSILDNVNVTFHGNNNSIVVDRACLNNVIIEVFGNGNSYEIGKDATVCNFIIRSKVGAGPCQDADRTVLRIGDAAKIDQGQAILGADDTRIEIGRATTVVESKFFAVERDTSISVGEGCLFSWSIELRTSDWHSLLDSDGTRINPPASVKVGNKVWIGSDVRVLKGVSIGDGAIIGTGSIVTRDVPESAVAAGNPARIVRRNVSWNHDASLKA